MKELDDYIDKVKSLPPAPRLLPELLTLLRNDTVDSSRVVELISFDPAITANVLRLCNSAAFSGAMPASDLSEAVTRLGFRQVYTLVAAVSGVRALSPAQPGYGISAGELWKHSVTTAVAAQLIARSKADEDESVIFTAALLHDIGKIVLAEALEHIYAKLVEDSQSQQLTLLENEKRLLGVQHAEIGGRLLARWKFPPNLVSAVWHHHQPAAAEPHQRLAAYVYLGNMIAYFMGQGYGTRSVSSFEFQVSSSNQKQETSNVKLTLEALELLDLKPDAIPEFMIQTFEELQTVEALLRAA